MYRKMISYEETRKGKHLTSFERGSIAQLYEQGYSPYAIGKKLHRASNTIRNELRRGTTVQLDHRTMKTYQKYFPETGQAVYEKHRRRSCCCLKKEHPKTAAFLREVECLVLKTSYSLDVARQLVLSKGRYQMEDVVCTRTLYSYVERGEMKMKNIDLPNKVGRKTRKKRPVAKHKYGRSIEERGERVNLREEFGHWEIDLVLGKKTKDEALLTLTERKTRKEVIRKIQGKKEKEVLKALREILNEVPYGVFRTITADNGREFLSLETLEEEYPLQVYYAHPYAAYERGSNEINNRLIRRHFKKGKPIRGYPEEKVAYVEDWMNDMPRRLLGYRTSREMFEEEVRKLVESKGKENMDGL